MCFQGCGLHWFISWHQGKGHYPVQLVLRSALGSLVWFCCFFGPGAEIQLPTLTGKGRAVGAPEFRGPLPVDHCYQEISPDQGVMWESNIMKYEAPGQPHSSRNLPWLTQRPTFKKRMCFRWDHSIGIIFITKHLYQSKEYCEAKIWLSRQWKKWITRHWE